MLVYYIIPIPIPIELYHIIYDIIFCYSNHAATLIYHAFLIMLARYDNSQINVQITAAALLHHNVSFDDINSNNTLMLFTCY